MLQAGLENFQPGDPQQAGGLLRRQRHGHIHIMNGLGRFTQKIAHRPAHRPRPGQRGQHRGWRAMAQEFGRHRSGVSVAGT